LDGDDEDTNLMLVAPPSALMEQTAQQANDLSVMSGRTIMACGDSLEAGPCVESAIGLDARDVLIMAVLLEQFGIMSASPTRIPVRSIARISNYPASTPEGLSPLTPLARTMLSPAPFPVTHRLDARAVDQPVQWPGTGGRGS
jgi:hypothetical protein